MLNVGVKMIQTNLPEYWEFSPTQRDRILRMLIKLGWVSTEAMKIEASQYGARILELRDDGHQIESLKLNGTWGFKYNGRQKVKD